MICPLDPDPLARLLAQLSGDLVLVLDEQGVVRGVAAGADTPLPAGADGWEGRPWGDCVAPDSRAKVSRMLRELTQSGRARRRELNHPQAGGGFAAFAYHAQRLPGGGMSLAMGRDLRLQSALQQRLLQAQQEIASGGWR